MSYVIHSYPNNPYVFKSLIAAEFGGIKIDYPSDFKMGEDNKTSEFKSKNPNGQVPILDSPDGPVWESNAIVRYIARKGDKGLLGSNDYEATLVDQWIDWSRSKIEPNRWGIIGPIIGYAPFDQKKHDDSKAAIGSSFEVLNGHLQGKEYVVGNRVTLADIVLLATYWHILLFAADTEFVKPFPNVINWVNKLVANEHFKKVLGEFKWPEQEAAPGSVKIR